MNRLKEIRKKSGITQEELSERSGVSRTTIVALERQESVDMKLSTLLKLADTLGHSVAEIFLADVSSMMDSHEQV